MQAFTGLVRSPKHSLAPSFKIQNPLVVGKVLIKLIVTGKKEFAVMMSLIWNLSFYYILGTITTTLG